MVAMRKWKKLSSALLRCRDGGPRLGILCFEAARAMSRMVSIHRYLSDCDLRSTTVFHQDQMQLLRRACAELSLELDSLAASVSLLAVRCRSPWPRAFQSLYSAVKSDDFSEFHRRFLFSPKESARKFARMQRYAAETALLYAEMEVLAEMEAAERKRHQWRNYSGPITAPPSRGGKTEKKKKNTLLSQRQVVRRVQEGSLWSMEVEEAAELMARGVLTTFVRLCAVFAAVAPAGRAERLCRRKKGWAEREMLPEEGTVGAAGLELRYAEVVAAAERMMQSPEMVGDEARGELYRLLPEGLRVALAARRGEVGESKRAAERGAETARRALDWLGPIAEDTAAWHSGRRCERQWERSAAEKVLAVQTFRFADRRRTEAAMADMLVGLSCLVKHLRRKQRREEGEGPESM